MNLKNITLFSSIIITLGVFIAACSALTSPTSSSSSSSLSSFSSNNSTNTNTFMVTYNADGATAGNVPIDANKYLNGQQVTILGNTGGMSISGYNFAGWTNASGTVYCAGTTFSMGSSDITLFADWVPVYTTVNTENTNDFPGIDSAIRNMASPGSIQGLINYIQSISYNDWDRARGAYDWIVYNITYDWAAFSNGTISEADHDPNLVFENRLGDCGGHSALYSNIIAGLGLKAQVIAGSDQYGSYSNSIYCTTNIGGLAIGSHAWNAVLIDGSWHFMETTWAEVNFHGAYTTILTNCWSAFFDMDPRLFVFNHFPLDTNWLLMPSNMTLVSWASAPQFNGDLPTLLVLVGYTPDQILGMCPYLPLPESFSWYALWFVQMGGNKSDMLSYLKQDCVPSVWYDGTNTIQLQAYPTVSQLQVGSSYSFSVLVPA